MLRSIVFLAAVVVVVAVADPASESRGWNELVNADGIFRDHLNTIEFKSSGDDDLLTEFKNLLSDETSLKDVYTNYKTLYGKLNEVTKDRLDIFKENLVQIAAHNLDASAGKATWFMGVNQFSDLSSREMIRAPFANDTADELNSRPYKSTNKAGAPASINYVSQNVVSSVKNQGQCESCSMFSSAAILESAIARKYRTAPVDLSVQELMDCAVRGHSCSVGTSAGDSLNYYQTTGATTWAAYPYTGVVGSCQTASKPIVAHAASNQVYFNQLEASLMQLLSDHGPLVVYIYSSPALGSYRSGVFTGPDCGTYPNNHAVTLVGYGTDSSTNQAYWLIKNSWGATWGESGYFRMLRANYRVCDLGAQAYSVVAA